MPSFVCPRPLRPGDCIHAIAPSSPFPATLGWCGLGWLASRYRVCFSRDVFRTHGYLAGTDDLRAQQLTRALQDPQARAIVAMRGGYGLHRIVGRVDWSLLAANPKWIVGFSDITALHVEAAAAGIMSMHASMLAQLGRGDAHARQRWLEALEHPEQPRCWTGLTTWKTGQAAGPLVGGNLSVLHASCVAGRWRLPEGAILFIEDVGERPYRLDRMLTTLLHGGHFDAASGVIVGQLTDCYPGADGWTAEQVVREVLGNLSVPIVAGLPAGHDLRNDPIILGAPARIIAGPSEASVIING